MKDVLERKLYKRFKFFKSWNVKKQDFFRVKNGTIGAACGDGWFKLIWELCEHIELELKLRKIKGANFHVTDIKEKFGQLRFYCNGNDWIWRLTLIAEDISGTVCETCGKPGKTEKVDGWLMTCCPKHLEARIAESEKRRAK